ncbi:hypothetical protein GCM10010885_09640 [Alicyclobacillus cellulosilyticus]|uniref:SGNH hydrolase-type esterase domain-containing protein n=1 Tax=Alicyclobacillus cellulosilyticus TaxID=1003997 RepID=A0A917K716_9BACL|nr:SGNH/GDSL hydrolase family protein [Alicyclobacillus cellulosilyticus]GGJ02413.1 hypothetical protein GCM10010885_09640 [Alicyclobacillus cellulosilyticus]
MPRRSTGVYRITVALFAACAAVAAPAASGWAKQEQHLVALGDSITYGLYLAADTAHPAPQAYPFLVARDEGWQVTNLAVPGWTSADLLHALATPRFTAALRQATVVTVDIGSNDLLRAAAPLLARYLADGSLTVTPADTARLQAAAAAFAANLPRIVAAIRRQTAAPLVLLNLYDPFPDRHPLHPLAEEVIAAENQAILTVAAQSQSLFADVYLVFNHHQAEDVRVAAHDVHPTVAGQRALAQCVEDALAHPLAASPHFYAVAPRGAVIRSQPSPAAPALFYLHGNQGVLVIGAASAAPGAANAAQDAANAAPGAANAAPSAAAAWLQVVTPDGQRGDVPAGEVQTFIRPWNDPVFADRVVRLAAAPGTPAVSWQGTVYVPAAWLARQAGGRAAWHNTTREVALTTPGAAGVRGAAASGAANRAASAAAGGVSGDTSGGIEWATRTTIPVPSGTPAPQTVIRLAGIELTIDGEPIRLAHPPFLWQGQVYLPAAEVWTALGGEVRQDARGLTLLSPAGS